MTSLMTSIQVCADKVLYSCSQKFLLANGLVIFNFFAAQEAYALVNAPIAMDSAQKRSKGQWIL